MGATQQADNFVYLRRTELESSLSLFIFPLSFPSLPFFYAPGNSRIGLIEEIPVPQRGTEQWCKMKEPEGWCGREKNREG